MTAVLLHGQVLAAADGPQWADGGVWIDDSGRVRAIGNWPEVAAAAGPAVPIRDHRPHWIVPGIIDLHVHLTLPGGWNARPSLLSRRHA